MCHHNTAESNMAFFNHTSGQTDVVYPAKTYGIKKLTYVKPKVAFRGRYVTKLYAKKRCQQ